MFMRGLIDAIFFVALPLAIRLPLRLGMKVAGLIGRVCYRLDLDWRTVALRQHYVAGNTRLAFEEIAPEAPAHVVKGQVRQRFLIAAKDELEAYWLHADRARECVCTFDGLDAVQAHFAQGRGLVMVTIHYDAALMGVAQLGLAGCKLNLMTTEVIEDPRLPASVKRYFQKKRSGLELHLNGGRVLNVETRLMSFYDGIQDAGAVAIFAEAPTAQLDVARNIRFLGKQRAVAPGAFRIAERTGAAMVAFVSLCTGPGRYHVTLSPIFEPDTVAGHTRNADAMFDFFSQTIEREPGRWWAADQLPKFINFPAGQAEAP